MSADTATVDDLDVPLAIVVAAASNGVIGRDNRLLWRLKTDLRRFRALTLGKPLVMGRKTFQSIGKPLPGRECIVVTRDRTFRPEGVRVVHDLGAALALGRQVAREMDADAVMIGGGGEIYAATLPLADRVHLTEVALAPEGDAHFPPLDPTQFRAVHREEHPAGPDDEAAFAFVDYERRDGPGSR
jgi:dihydrofolate reductase